MFSGRGCCVAFASDVLSFVFVHDSVGLREDSSVVAEVQEADGVDEEEHEEMPEDLSHLDPATQQYHVKLRAAWLMIAGTTLVLIFSGEHDEWGSRSGTTTKN